MIAESAVVDELLKESIINHPFAHFHEDEEGIVPRTSSILKLRQDSLHAKLTFGDVSRNDRRYIERTALEGIRIHEAVQTLLLTGERPTLHSEDEEKKMQRFEQWAKINRPEFIHRPDSTIISHEQKYGGTPDIVCNIRGKNFVIDIKTGSHLHDINFVQAESYAMLVREKLDICVDRIAVLLLGQRKSVEECLHVRLPDARREKEFQDLLKKWHTLFPEPFGERHRVTTSSTHTIDSNRTLIAH